MHFNTLADCLARSAPAFSRKRGFRCDAEALAWGYRSKLLERELLRHQCDVIGLCEVDQYEEFFEPALEQQGYKGTFRRKRSPARDGVAIFWRAGRLAEGLRRAVFLEQGIRRSKAAQVALLQRLSLEGDAGCAASNHRSLVVCSTHLRAHAGHHELRMQQAAEVVTALTDFARTGEAQVVFADVNSDAAAAELGGSTESVLEYFHACGYRCAYRSLQGQQPRAAAPASHGGHRLPAYTTWAGWASGDFRAVCDHIFVSKDIHVVAALDVPAPEVLEVPFPERLPNYEWPSDHMSLVVDVVLA